MRCSSPSPEIDSPASIKNTNIDRAVSDFDLFIYQFIIWEGGGEERKEEGEGSLLILSNNSLSFRYIFFSRYLLLFYLYLFVCMCVCLIIDRKKKATSTTSAMSTRISKLAATIDVETNKQRYILFSTLMFIGSFSLPLPFPLSPPPPSLPPLLPFLHGQIGIRSKFSESGPWQSLTGIQHERRMNQSAKDRTSWIQSKHKWNRNPINDGGANVELNRIRWNWSDYLNSIRSLFRAVWLSCSDLIRNQGSHQSHR